MTSEKANFVLMSNSTLSPAACQKKGINHSLFGFHRSSRKCLLLQHKRQRSTGQEQQSTSLVINPYTTRFNHTMCQAHAFSLG